MDPKQMPKGLAGVEWASQGSKEGVVTCSRQIGVDEPLLALNRDLRLPAPKCFGILDIWKAWSIFPWKTQTHKPGTGQVPQRPYTPCVRDCGENDSGRRQQHKSRSRISKAEAETGVELILPLLQHGRRTRHDHVANSSSKQKSVAMSPTSMFCPNRP